MLSSREDTPVHLSGKEEYAGLHRDSITAVGPHVVKGWGYLRMFATMGLN